MPWGDGKFWGELPARKRRRRQGDGERGCGVGAVTPQTDRAIVRIPCGAVEMLEFMEPDDGRQGEQGPR
jgi:hypothetical protein